MALKLKYTDEHGILHINMSPTSTPRVDPTPEKPITDPKFDTINNRFAQYDLFGGKYDVQPAEQSGGEEERSLFRSRYNSIEEELANTPYAFTSERNGLNSLNKPVFDITIKSRGVLDDASPSKDIEDDRFFNRNLDDDLFGPQLDQKSPDSDTPAFTVTQLIHAQDRYFDLSSRQSSSLSKNSKSESVKSLKSKFEFRSAPSSAKKDKTVTIVERVKSGSAKDEAFTVLPQVKAVQEVELTASLPSVPLPTSKRKRESSFAIIAETPVTSRPASPTSLPVESRSGRSSPFRGRGFREETSRHSTPRTSAAPSRATSPLPAPRHRTSSLNRLDNRGDKLDYRVDKLDTQLDNRLDNMAATTLPPPMHHTPHSPINFLKQNIEEVRELSELNREMHEAEAEKKKREEEEALLKEMEEFEKSTSVVGSRSNSRSNSPSKVRLRSRSSSPAAILHYENLPEGEVKENGVVRPERKSRLRSVSKSQPQSNNGSPKHSKIPKRQNSVSPSRGRWESSKRPVENNLNRNQRFISNSTSSINDTIKLGSVAQDKRAMSKSTQHLSISPKHIKGKPPISPGRYGPPPSNKAINAKRLSPIVGTPNKSPTEDHSKPNSARTPMKPSPVAKKPVKTVGNTPATSRLNSRQPSRSVTRDPSPEKRRNISSRPAPKPVTKPLNKPVNRTQSTRTTVKPKEPAKSDVKKPMNRTTSMKSLNRTPSTKNLNGKPPLKKVDSKKDLKEKAQSTSSINDVGNKKEAIKEEKNENKEMKRDIDLSKKENKTKDVQAKSTDGSKTNGVKTTEAATTESTEEISKQDIQTQFDSITNEKGELIIMTKKNIVSMTTAAITSQPLEVVTAVTNQLPAALEKAREKAIFERNSSKDSLAPKDDNKETEDKTADDKKSSKSMKSMDDSIKMKLLQPPYNNPQVERARQKIEDILKSPEVSTENILTPEPKETKPSFKTFANKAKSEIKETKIEITNKFTEIKDQAVKQNTKMQDEIRSEATKIVNSIITPVEDPKELKETPKEEVKTIEPIVTVVNEKKTTNGPKSADIVVKTTETLVKGEPDVEVQSSNMSTPVNKMAALHKMADGNGSDKSASNGGFPQSTSTTPKPPARANRSNQSSTKEDKTVSKDPTPENEPKKQNICQRLMGKCAKKSNCCCCCIKPEDDEIPAMVKEEAKEEAKKEGMISKFNCCKKKEKEMEEKMEKEIERAAGKVSLDFENETPHPPKRKLTSVLCCGRGRRVSDVSQDLATPMTTGCCGKRRPVVERRDSILSDRPSTTCCNNRLFNWMRGACRRRRPSDQSSSRRTSLFSKNKSLSPTLPPEDTRAKLDPSLVEHTSVIRGAIPVLPRALAWLCLVCNVVVPGLGSILSGLFCLCFGIPRFGAHDGAKYRIGAFVTNLFVGCGQLFTVLFCLVGWGWSIWWGVIMVRVSRKYRKLRAEAAAEEDQQPPPVTANNHTQA